jgi:hypothetical protein
MRRTFRFDVLACPPVAAGSTPLGTYSLLASADDWLLVTFGPAAAVNKRLGVTPRMQDRLAAASTR